MLWRDMSLNIVDCLLKPFNFERFMKAIQKLEANKNEVPTPIKGESEEGLFLRANKKLFM